MICVRQTPNLELSPISLKNHRSNLWAFFYQPNKNLLKFPSIKGLAANDLILQNIPIHLMLFITSVLVNQLISPISVIRKIALLSSKASLNQLQLIKKNKMNFKTYNSASNISRPLRLWSDSFFCRIVSRAGVTWCVGGL